MKIMIVEDNALLQQNLQFLFDGEANMQVTTVADSAEEALALFVASEVEVAICDLGLPGMGGVELITELHRRAPSLQIIVNTVYEAQDMVFDAIRAGASGYILKGASPRELIDAVNELYNGGAPMSPRIARKVILEMQKDAIAEQYLLSPREVEVLKQIEAGMSYADTGEALGISMHTVNAHIKKIYSKLQAKNRAEALTKARQKGII